MPLTFNCLELYSPNTNIYTGLLKLVMSFINYRPPPFFQVSEGLPIIISQRQRPIKQRKQYQKTLPEGSLGVDKEALALRAAVVDGELAGHRQGVAQLRFTRSKESLKL